MFAGSDYTIFFCARGNMAATQQPFLSARRSDRNPTMLYGRYLFSIVFEDNAILPEYKGSTFRGAFGHALKMVVCALKRQDCLDCLLREKCIYPYTFETTPRPVTHDDPVRVSSPPHPYMIEPPDNVKTRYAKGDIFEFSLVLFGQANEHLPYFVYAFEQMGQTGIGKYVIGHRPSFVLKSVTAAGQTVYTDESKKITTGHFTEDLSLTSFETPDRFSHVELKLLTPLRFKYENHFLNASIPFHVLTRAMLRRISALCEYYGDGEPHLDYRGLVEQARSIEIGESSVRWYDWRRFSNRQDQAMLMGGMIGNLTYTGDLTEFLPLIRFCEKVHVGKQTTFGLGKFALKTLT
jgi:CRISPR/Cas system endoribonuclease Cas6 (RAMP superfamily)